MGAAVVAAGLAGDVAAETQGVFSAIVTQWKPVVSKWAPALHPPTVEAVRIAPTVRPDVVTARVSPETEKVSESPQRPSADQVVRQLYDRLGGKRPGTKHIVSALSDAGLPHSEGTAREARKRVEMREPKLKGLPPV
ncbi:hypothetical protein OHB56_33510 [Streptomyces sp. NBC_01635]|uniref:hypothetical protein n=1 Tax=Streptomyces sp. NBC_01635 TaxID=2975904 RepID=UPI003863E02C|nr:hypothetical protein OHB56_33510 [Streptomyces sp. NBC_01635]